MRQLIARRVALAASSASISREVSSENEMMAVMVRLLLGSDEAVSGGCVEIIDKCLESLHEVLNVLHERSYF